ncbi:LemA family protein, partial [Eubacterium aggregans]
LKANTNFIDLQEQLKAVEEDIANARKYYNGSVKNLNNKIEMFPSSIVAGMFGFTKNPFFEIDIPQERENVKVSF